MTYFIIPSGPGAVSLFSARDNVVLEARAIRVRGELSHNTSFQPLVAVRVLLEPACWLYGGLLFCLLASFSSIPAFLPTIVHGMGFTALMAQGLSAPPYVVAYLCCIALCFVSDRVQDRGTIIAGCALVGGAGYLTLHLASRTAVRYGAIYMVTAGVFPAIALTYSWATDRQDSSDKRGGGLILLGMLGQCGTFVGAHIFPEKDAPLFQPGMLILAIMLFVGAVLAVLLSLVLREKNSRPPPV